MGLGSWIDFLKCAFLSQLLLCALGLLKLVSNGSAVRRQKANRPQATRSQLEMLEAYIALALIKYFFWAICNFRSLRGDVIALLCSLRDSGLGDLGMGKFLGRNTPRFVVSGSCLSSL
jgi:hypothetical protein